MEKLEQVEALVDKCGVSYSQAKEALEATNYDMLDAIIYLEQHGVAAQSSARVQTSAETQTGPSREMAEAQEAYERSSRQSAFSKNMEGVWDSVKRLAQRGMELNFVIERGSERVAAIPLLVVLLSMIIWWFVLPLVVVGLFFGFRYRIDGLSPVTVDVNEAMGKAADSAEQLKHDFARDSEHKA